MPQPKRPETPRLAHIAAAAFAVATSTLVACTVNPTTGRSYLNTLSKEQEIAVANEAAPEMVASYGGAIQDPTINNYVTNVGMSMASETEGDYPTYPWEFTVLNSEIINAFALPGGKVFISRGLLERMDNEAQMAGVLGHEIAHVTAQHIDERLTRTMGIQIGATVLAAILASQTDSDVAQYAVPAISTGAGLYALTFDRDQELESDLLGMRYMTRAGYDPKGQLDVMKILRSASQGAGQQPEFLSTHPHPESRIEAIEYLLQTEFAETQQNPNYVTNPARFQQQMLARLSSIPVASTRRGVLPLLEDGESMPMEVVWALNAGWCGTCRAELMLAGWRAR